MTPTPEHKPGTATRLRVADLPTRKPTRFDLAPDAQACAELAQELGLIGLRKLRFAGQIAPAGKHDWHLEATLGATVTQACVVTLAPVTTRLEEPVRRHFLTQLPDEDAVGEVEMPEDETIEALGAEIDLGAIMAEALALALPLYPRAEDAALDQAQFAEPGITPMRDEDTRPFAGLAGLRDKLNKGD